MTRHLFVPFLYLKLMTHIVCWILSPMLFPIPNLLLFLPFTYPNDILSFQITLFKYVINIYAGFSQEGNCVWWRLPTLTFLEIIQWNFWMTIIYCKWQCQHSFTKHFKLRLEHNTVFLKTVLGLSLNQWTHTIYDDTDICLHNRAHFLWHQNVSNPDLRVSMFGNAGH